jgi:hypothetical protein
MTMAGMGGASSSGDFSFGSWTAEGPSTQGGNSYTAPGLKTAPPFSWNLSM